VGVRRLFTERGVKPRLAQLLVAMMMLCRLRADQSARCAEVGIESAQLVLPASTNTNDLLTVIARFKSA